MWITFVTRQFGNVERNSHCDVLHIAPVRVVNLVLDCNGVFAIKAYYLPLDGSALRILSDDARQNMSIQWNLSIVKSRDQKKCSLYGGVHPRGVIYVHADMCLKYNVHILKLTIVKFLWLLAFDSLISFNFSSRIKFFRFVDMLTKTD